MKKILFPFLFSLSIMAGHAQTQLPALSDDLKKNANAVVRFYSQTFEIKNIGSATEKIKEIITVLNKKGDSEADFAVSYDPYSKISSLSGIVVGGDGKVIKKVKRVDFGDYPAYDGSSFYSDLKVLSYDPVVNAYPYTVEFEYEVNHNGLMQYPIWLVQHNSETAVENSSFEVITNNGVTFRHSTNRTADPVISIDGNKKSYLWKVSNLPAYPYEPFSPSMLDVSPIVFTAPDEFEFHNVPGKMATWIDFGNWISGLNKGRDEIPPATKANIRKLIEGAPDTTEMVKRIYSYLQNKTRYVGVQLGIGGYQPMPAKEVDELGYGDCKALSNYMVSLLKSVGIKADYSLVSAGGKASLIKQAFPINLFNHVIVCVPFSKDTLWLECTSQHAPFGYLGSSTYNRNVLLIDEKGPKLARTIDYPANKNTQFRSAQIEVDINGNATATVSTFYSGLQYENVAGNIYNEPSEQKKWFENNNQIPVFQLLDYKYSKPCDFVPVVEEKQTLRLDRYAGVNANMLIIPLNLMNKRDYGYKQLKQRKTEVEISWSYNDVDTVIFKLPENIKPDAIPQSQEIKSDFGTYKTSVVLEKNTLMYVRNLTVKRCKYPAEKYQELVDFFDNIAKADKCKAIFNKS